MTSPSRWTSRAPGRELLSSPGATALAPEPPRRFRAHGGPGEVLITALGIVEGWTLQQWVLQPGCGEGPHRHGNDGVQLERYRVVSGEVVLTVEGHRYHLRADSGVQIVDAAAQRAVVNEAAGEAVLEVAFQVG